MVRGIEPESLLWDKSKSLYILQITQICQYLLEEFVARDVEWLHDLKAPNEDGIWIESWLFDKSNKVQMLSLLVEIPCFDFFPFTVKSLNSK